MTGWMNLLTKRVFALPCVVQQMVGLRMKTVVTLLLLCLCDPGQSDCRADCLSCSNIFPQQLSFNTMVRRHKHICTHKMLEWITNLTCQMKCFI